MKFLSRLAQTIGVELQSTTHAEKIVSLAGGFTGILAVVVISRWALDAHHVAVVASMGASAVLLFAVPHGALSQPWPLVGGHLVSAVVGVTCAQWIPVDWLAAPAAVGIAIGAMHYLRCIHPPGGATALVAVLGGPAVTGLGYQYVLAPVGLNVLVILLAAVAFNWPFAWRRYPASWVRRTEVERAAPPRPSAYPPIAHEDLVYALSQVDSFIDVSEEDLLRIYQLATRQDPRGNAT